MSNHHPIPDGDAQFDEYCNNIVGYVLAKVIANPPKWTSVTKPEPRLILQKTMLPLPHLFTPFIMKSL
jgi:hypothetical protein